MNKFNATKVEIDGHKFDSKAEGERYVYLLEQVRNGQIRDLELQPKLVFMVHGEPVKSAKGRTLSYKPDFRYWKKSTVGGQVHWLPVYEDVKGMATDLWRWKWQFAKAHYPKYKFIAVRKIKDGWKESVV